MASKITVNTTRFRKRAADYITHLKASSYGAILAGLEEITALATSRAPTPEEEENEVNLGYGSYSEAFVPKKADKKEELRNHFFKNSGQMYIIDAIKDFRVWRIGETSLQGPIIPVIDELTKWSWTNVQSTKGETSSLTYESEHGTFWFFEYGYVWNVSPVNAKFLALPDGSGGVIYANSATKSIPAHGMFTKLDWAPIRNRVIAKLNQVEF